MLPSGADLASGGLGGGSAAVGNLLPQLMAASSQASQTSTALVKHLSSLSNAVSDATRSGISSFETLKSSLSRFGSGMASTMEGILKVGSGPSAAGNSADGLAILGGAGSLLGQLGGGAMSLFEGAGKGASSLLSSGADAVGAVGKGVGGAVSGAVSMGTGVAGAALSLAVPGGAIVGGIVSAIGPLVGNMMGGMVSALFTPLKAVLSGLSSAFSTVTSVLGTLGETALKALGAFGSAVMAATEAALKMAHEVASIRNNTGRSLGDSQRGYWNLRGAGLSGEAASGFLSNAGSSFVSQNRTRAWGLPGATEASFPEKFAALFQRLEASGPTGHEQAMAMANSVSGGKASPELLQLAHMKPETIQREQKWTQGVQKSLGVTPEAIRRLADEFPLFINRVSTFVEAVKVRFATTLLPMMQAALNGLTTFLASHADQIASVIQSAVEWLYVEGPTLILNGAQMGLAGIEMLVTGFYSFAQGAADFLRSIGNAQSGLFSFFEFVGSVIDGIIDGARTLGLTDAKTDIGGDLANWRNSGTPEKMAEGIETFIKNGKSVTDPAFKTAHNALNATQKGMGTEDDRKSGFHTAIHTLTNTTKDLNATTKESGQKIVEAIHKTAPKDNKKSLLSYVGSMVAADQYMSVTR